MKILIAVLLALVLALAACSALAESAETAPVTPNNWVLRSLTDTDWIQKEGRATLEIAPTPGDEEQFTATVHWANSADEATEWTFTGNYNWEGHQLQFVWESRITCRYDENGDLTIDTGLKVRISDYHYGPDYNTDPFSEASAWSGSGYYMANDPAYLKGGIYKITISPSDK